MQPLRHDATGCAQAGSRLGWAALEAKSGWIVVVRGETIEAAGPPDEVKVPESRPCHRTARHDSTAGTDRPHTHVLLHPYDEAPWDDQVLKEAWHCAFAERPTTCEARFFPDSQRSAIWEPRGPVMPTSG